MTSPVACGAAYPPAMRGRGRSGRRRIRGVPADGRRGRIDGPAGPLGRAVAPARSGRRRLRCSDRDLSGAIRLAARSEGLLLDPVYSGKALAGLMSLEHSALPAKVIVFLVTGGVPALFTSRYEGWLAEVDPEAGSH